MEGLPRFFTLFVRLARPIDFDSIDGLPVDLVILLLTPANSGNQHLATLAALSRPLRDATFVQQLRRAPDADALHRLIADA
jgi:PTS system nitrogen regulatory IIA component